MEWLQILTSPVRRGHKAWRLAPILPHRHKLITRPEFPDQSLILFTSTTTQKQHPRRMRRGQTWGRFLQCLPDGFIILISLKFRNTATLRLTNQLESNLPNSELTWIIITDSYWKDWFHLMAVCSHFCLLWLVFKLKYLSKLTVKHIA